MMNSAVAHLHFTHRCLQSLRSAFQISELLPGSCELGHVQYSIHRQQCTHVFEGTTWKHPSRNDQLAKLLPLHGFPLQFNSCRQLHVDTPRVNSAEDVHNIPNYLSVGRGVSGPFIAYLILCEEWHWALAAITVSGATDWLDGYLARRMNLQSVVGSYLDPLGDKMLICSVVAALALKGVLPVWLAGLIIGRDVTLVAGAVLQRWSMLGWRRVPLHVFFSTAIPSNLPASGGQGNSHRTVGAKEVTVGAKEVSVDVDVGGSEEAKHSEVVTLNGNNMASVMKASSTPDKILTSIEELGSTGGSTDILSDPRSVKKPCQAVHHLKKSAGAGVLEMEGTSMPLMKPLFVSKANTVLQLTLVAGYLGKGWVDWPDADALQVMAVATAMTTALSSLAYAHKVLVLQRG
ncbi:hypothetical protein CEUSTIGMA_g2134.t1 [Chlamydomonas eustigma]|uniref:CDP-diacylglycerol--glycerol-3-phosphate 3-phosphatidyltransferase n=1 Tax=Chlamydomonas eustigma TaxID=1157962 RepID=A0A250WVA1_9CHLO|nr:hypothetical protein CEUSTIGMA_g2134.t1 [Chlamydomonas eustigma]|eukprot:GAX74686.1 hypothetical protein CEUSTIGMA_g2134.t1 [Chlamydomonas eustigma]